MFRSCSTFLVRLCACVLGWAGSGFPATAAEADASSAALRELRGWLDRPRAERTALTNAPFAATALTRADADAALALLWRDRTEHVRATRAGEMRDKMIEIDGRRMRFDWRVFDDTNTVPVGGRSLFLSLHGGGGAPRRVNDSQWTNQVRLGTSYRPAEGIYVAPRAPTDTWNLWHEAHIDTFFSRLIENFVVFENVNPNRVFLMGYSAGGDGVYQVAPRTPDRWAAAAMMAGHPNEASPLGLRNVPFAIHVGERDTPYRRHEIAVEWGRKLGMLRKADPGGYVHVAKIHPGKGHWMELADREAVPWMEAFSRNPLPDRVVWFQDDVTHARSYWLARPAGQVAAGQWLSASRNGQTVTLRGTNVASVTVLLNDTLLDLDRPVEIRAGDRTLFSAIVPRTVARLSETLETRGDPHLAFPSAVTVALPQGSGVP